MNRLFAALALTSLFLVGCAPNPVRIAPRAVAVSGYLAFNCEQLTNLRINASNTLDAESQAQRAVRRSDAWYVFLTGLPLARMSGESREARIAPLKGELIAIDTARAHNQCGS
jgi:hypothetical protein